MTEQKDKPVLFFDGVCNLCNGLVQFMLKRDRDGKFYYVPLQSAAAQRLLANQPVDPEKLDSLILINGSKVLQRSSAVLKIASVLGGIYKLWLIFYIIPVPIRDWIYNRIAANRYRWFGKKAECMVPTPEIKERFITE